LNGLVIPGFLATGIQFYFQIENKTVFQLPKSIIKLPKSINIIIESGLLLYMDMDIWINIANLILNIKFAIFIHLTIYKYNNNPL